MMQTFFKVWAFLSFIVAVVLGFICTVAVLSGDEATIAWNHVYFTMAGVIALLITSVASALLSQLK